MRHGNSGRQLSRNTSHRVALLRNLSRALITHESIVTTTPKAKSLRPFIEKLVTLAKKAALADDGTPAGKAKALHYRRLAMADLGPMHGTGVYEKNNDPVEVKTADTVLKKLFNVIGPRFKTRPGGYTRILKMQVRRLGDAGEQSVIEFLKEGEGKVGGNTKKAEAPAPSLAVQS
jgi:large subunit ribosomal protein L17